LIFRFGPFELDDGSGDLLRDGQPVPLQPKPLALLRLLVIERDRIVPTEEILAALWPDTRVSGSSLPRAASHARRAIGDTHEAGILRSYPRRGYRFCAEVIALDNTPVAHSPGTPSGTGASDAAASSGVTGAIPFVGRESALATLGAGLEHTLRGRGACVLISGCAGIGKSRLIEEFGRQAEGRGAKSFTGCARDREGMPALWIFEQILRQLLRDPDLSADARGFTEQTNRIGALLPELGAPEPDASRSGQIERSRFEFFDACCRLLARCARRRPMLLFLEDLQWAGGAALQLLEYLAAELAESPVLFVGSVREEVRAPGDRLLRTLAQLRRLERCALIELRGLSRGEIAELIRRISGQRMPPDLTSELYAQTEGIPLYLREAVRVLQKRTDIARPEQILELGFALPEPARELIGRALNDLPEPTRQFVAAACIVGREFDLRGVAAVADLSPEQALECIDAAVRAGVLEPAMGSAARYRFAHALHREVAYAGLSPAKRTQLHARAAAHLERRHAHDLDRVIAELAHHHLQAIAIGDPERAYDCARRAAERAERVFAYEQMASHYEQALESLDHCEPVEPLRRLETLLALGSAHRLAGDRARRREVLSEALDRARALRRDLEFARAAIDFCDISEWSHDDPAARMVLNEALERLGNAHETERARLLTRLAYLAQRNRGEAEPFARSGVELARAGGDPDALQDALYVLSYTIAGPHDLEERAQLADEILKLAKQDAAHTPCVISLIDAACDRIALGDLQGAAERRRQTEELVAAHATPVMRWHIKVYDTGFALMRGELGAAEELAEEAYRIGQRIRHPFASGCHLAHRMGIAREREHWDEVIALLSQLKGPDAPYVWVRSILGRAELAAGNRAAATHIWNQLSEPRASFPEVAPGIRWTDSMVELAHLCADLGAEAHADRLITELDAAADQHGVLPVPICYGGPVAHCLARLHALRGDREAAEAHFERGLESVRALEAPTFEARLLIDFAAHSKLRSPTRARQLERAAEAILAARRHGDAPPSP